MHASDLLAFVLAVVGAMSALLAVLENLFPPPPDARRQRAAWAWGFVVLFILALATAFFQIRAAARERIADAQQAETQRKQEQKESQAQIDSLSSKLNAIQSANDGLKQLITQKNDKITALTQQELDVRRRELDLNYDMTIEFVYQSDRFVLYNRGKTNISLWGAKVDDTARDLGGTPRIIAPAGSYYLLTNLFEPWVRAKFPHEAEVRVPMQIYLSDELSRRYVAHFILFMQLNQGAITAVHTQMLGLTKTDWRKFAHK